MKYLLLGGSGFIGSFLASSLAKEHDVTVIGHGPKFGLPNVKYQQLDFTGCKDFTKYIKDIDVIIHMVSTIIPSDNLSNVNQEIADNIFPTTILLKNAAELKKEVVFISSGGTVYGENSKKNSEFDPENPICNYGITKLMIEKYLHLYHHFYGLKYKVIRLSNPYSEAVYHGKKQGVIPVIIDSIVKDRVIPVWGDKEVRDYIHIDDAIAGIIAVLNYKGKVRVFNLGSGIGHTVHNIITLAESKLNKKAKIEYHPARKCDVEKNVLDISLIKKETGWTPNIPLSKGIDKIIAQKTNGEKI
ncbi:NAD-dependent epimerase/dehydratase family protein [Candidatus Saccharibacteria bacterium]|nr:NAD-dependent epimerase/dehydratase family protein [Candidatus Saccharibacteria bacterium]MBR0424036.1 NAD-dependent epimerase/dehydratase family protein [Candidatus Saccharibacteria bacterium]